MNKCFVRYNLIAYNIHESVQCVHYQRFTIVYKFKYKITLRLKAVFLPNINIIFKIYLWGQLLSSMCPIIHHSVNNHCNSVNNNHYNSVNNHYNSINNNHYNSVNNNHYNSVNNHYNSVNNDYNSVNNDYNHDYRTIEMSSLCDQPTSYKVLILLFEVSLN